MADHYVKSIYSSEQFEEALGLILSGEIDAAAESARASAQTAQTSAASAAAQAGYAAGAAQAVKDALDSLPEGAVPVINDLTTGGASAALSAEMGKQLQAEKADAAAVAAAMSNKVNSAAGKMIGPLYLGDEKSVLWRSAPDILDLALGRLSIRFDQSRITANGIKEAIYLRDIGNGAEYNFATAADLASKVTYGQMGIGGAGAPVPTGDCDDIAEFGVYRLDNNAKHSFSESLGVSVHGEIVISAMWNANTALQLSQTTSGALGYRTKSGVWWEWVPIATATPPQEYDLPLAEGVTATLASIYRKNQFGEVAYRLFATLTAVVSDGAIVATLPLGYRLPAGRGALFECGAITGNTRMGGNTITVRPDGAMVYNGPALPAGSKLWSHGSFTAA